MYIYIYQVTEESPPKLIKQLMSVKKLLRKTLECNWKMEWKLKNMIITLRPTCANRVLVC